MPPCLRVRIFVYGVKVCGGLHICLIVRLFSTEKGEVALSERERSKEEADGATLYWRITPDWLRLLCERFDEILCSVFESGDRGLQTVSFFYSLKSADDPDR